MKCDKMTHFGTNSNASIEWKTLKLKLKNYLFLPLYASHVIVNEQNDDRHILLCKDVGLIRSEGGEEKSALPPAKSTGALSKCQNYMKCATNWLLIHHPQFSRLGP